MCVRAGIYPGNSTSCDNTVSLKATTNETLDVVLKKSFECSLCREGDARTWRAYRSFLVESVREMLRDTEREV
jgi:hypothetical protein